MASIPCAAFSARKIHENIIKEQARAAFPRDDANSQKQNVTCAFTPPKYNDKLMNSIWGLYNRYAPPAFQKNFENPSQCSELAAPKTKGGLFEAAFISRCVSFVPKLIARTKLMAANADI